MNDNERTRTSANACASSTDDVLWCLTIAWHPDLSRIGQQCVLLHDVLDLARYQPLFARAASGITPGYSAELELPLGHDGISRKPVRIHRMPDGAICITPPISKMVLEVNGVAINGPRILTPTELETGVVLGLARAVLLCLHAMRCVPRHNPVEGLHGVSTAAIKTRDLIRQVASTNETVLLLGETGTGKDVAARAIHGLSLRSAQPMVSVNMAALNEGLAAAELFGAAKGAYTGAQNSRGGFFHEAQDATLFLDEIGNAPPAVQPMLLRVLESGDYRPLGATRDAKSNARIIAATDQDLYAQGFNHALLRRLESFIIPIPPLRARREDIGLLIAHTLQHTTLPDCARLMPPFSLVTEMLRYDWPGNIRQLRHVIKRILLAMRAGDVPSFASLLAEPRVGFAPLPLPLPSAIVALSGKEPAAASQTEASSSVGRGPQTQARSASGHKLARQRPADLSEADVMRAMQASGWAIRAAAELLGISRQSLYTLLETHSQIRRPERIPQTELDAALVSTGGDVDACAHLLKTPAEPLRRYLRLRQCL